MKNPIKNFEDYVKEEFVAVGFGQPTAGASWSTPGRTGYNTSAYDLSPIAGSIPDLSMGIAQQAHEYETNDNADHTGEAYIDEAKKHINESIDKAYESKCLETAESVEEAMVQVAGNKKPSGAFVLAKVITQELVDKGMIDKRDQGTVVDEIKNIIINSTF